MHSYTQQPSFPDTWPSPLSSQIPLDRTSRPHTGSRSCLVLKENRSPFLYVMRWTWACDVLGWSSLAAPAPCSQALQTGDQRYSPVGRGPIPKRALGSRASGQGCTSVCSLVHIIRPEGLETCTHFMFSLVVSVRVILLFKRLNHRIWSLEELSKLNAVMCPGFLQRLQPGPSCEAVT